MAVYVYEYLDTDGQMRTGRMEADSEETVFSRLRESNLRVLEIRVAGRGFQLAEFFKRLVKVKLKELALFTRQFSVMIGAGLPVLRCLDILQAQTANARFAEILGAVRGDVHSGEALAEALYKQRPVFSDLFVNMIRAAELGGILDTVLRRLASYLEKEIEINNKIKSALTYPAVVLVFAIAAMSIIVFKVMPEFKKVFEEMGVTLPLSTKLLINSATYLQHYWYAPLLVVGGSFAAIRLYTRSEQGRYNVDALKLRFPLIGPLIQKISIARFARTLGTLVSSGIPILRALEIVADTAGNKVISTAILEARDSVHEGQPINEPLAQSGVFPLMVTQMVAIGEETGQLDAMLTKISDFYEEEVDTTIGALTSLIEPIMIVLLGCMVGFIAVSVITPIYDMAAQIK